MDGHAASYGVTLQTGDAGIVAARKRAETRTGNMMDERKDVVELDGEKVRCKGQFLYARSQAGLSNVLTGTTWHTHQSADIIRPQRLQNGEVEQWSSDCRPEP